MGYDISKAPRLRFSGSSSNIDELNSDFSLSLDFIVAPPHMARYIEISSKIYSIYLKYLAPEDIHVYSIDEVFIDATEYLKLYKMTAHELAMTMVKDVLRHTGITATAGIGTNLFLCKIAMDIVAKRMPPDEDGVRIAELDEASYRKTLWDHTPLTDFWRVGGGLSKKLNAHGIKTMGDIARCSIYNEELFYKLFGVNAQLLIDHAWGWEPCTISDIKAYRPSSRSVCVSQVLKCPYEFDKARIIIKEMSEELSFDLIKREAVTDQIVLDIGYDVDNPHINDYKGELVNDRYGRITPNKSHGSCNIGRFTSSVRLITQAALEIFDGAADNDLLIRRITVTANHTLHESEVKHSAQQLSLFMELDTAAKDSEEEDKRIERERSLQIAMLSLRQKYGKNSLLRGLNYLEGATAIERNGQIGDHRA